MENEKHDTAQYVQANEINTQRERRHRWKDIQDRTASNTKTGEICHTTPHVRCGSSLTGRGRGAVRTGGRSGGRVPYLSLRRLHDGSQGRLERSQGTQEAFVDVGVLCFEVIQQCGGFVGRHMAGENLGSLVVSEARL